MLSVGQFRMVSVRVFGRANSMQDNLAEVQLSQQYTASRRTHATRLHITTNKTEIDTPIYSVCFDLDIASRALLYKCNIHADYGRRWMWCSDVWFLGRILRVLCHSQCDMSESQRHREHLAVSSVVSGLGRAVAKGPSIPVVLFLKCFFYFATFLPTPVMMFVIKKINRALNEF